ncbi:lytic transglycosylase domain-containing protein [bacterium]|nr:lytic transglycosylase domain-containing protein [bacterium]
MKLLQKILLGTLTATFAPAAWSEEQKSPLEGYAQKLGYENASKLKEEYEEFSKRVKAGFAPKDYFTLCRKTYQQSLCDVLKEHLKPLPTLSSSSRRAKTPTIPFRLSNKDKLQAVSIRTLARKIPNFSKKTLSSWAEEALKTKQCPKNLNLAVALELEQKEPEGADWKTIDSLWEEGLACVTPETISSEYIFLRAALSQIARNNFKKALTYLNSSIESKEEDEDFRSHHWKYFVLKELKENSAAEKQLDLIGEKFPLSWYWISHSNDHKSDPLEVLSKRSKIADVDDAQDSMTNQYLYWTRVAAELEKDPNDLRIFFEKVAQRVIAEQNIGLSQSTARTFNKMGLYRFQIYALSQVILKSPEKLNREHLELLFPRPFFENMKQHSGEIDTAILLGLARQESGFDSFARSSANARGLLQILHSTALGLNKKITHTDLYNYDLNIQLGAKYIARLLNRFDGSLEQALGAYNAGSTHMKRWKERYSWVKNEQLFMDFIPFRETRDYIPSIIRNAYWYHRLFPSLNENGNKKVISGKLLEPLLKTSQTKP